MLPLAVTLAGEAVFDAFAGAVRQNPTTIKHMFSLTDHFLPKSSVRSQHRSFSLLRILTYLPLLIVISQAGACN